MRMAHPAREPLERCNGAPAGCFRRGSPLHYACCAVELVERGLVSEESRGELGSLVR